MKNCFTILLACFILNNAHGQTEFPVYEKGLIYDNNTMNQLEYIVDSLNLKYKKCDVYKTYYSKHQTIGHYLSLDTGDIKAALKDMKSNLSFKQFVNKYPLSTIEQEQLIVKFEYKDYEDENILSFHSYLNDQSMRFDESEVVTSFKKNRNWIIEHWKASEYSKERIRAFYITSPFASTPLTNKYARLVQYVDCMIDTSTTIFTEKANRTGRRFNRKANPEIGAFLKYVNKITSKPEYDSDDYEKYQKKFSKWNKKRFAVIDRNLLNQEKFNRLLKEATNSAFENGGQNDEFEEYVARYVSKKKALDLKRNRIVVGGCSRDRSPRYHAMNIAQLSAETVNWETFLRAHLDIMNDRFERASDGSYAWEERNTYIKELEELDIDALNLLIGISLRIENPAENHYYGSIGRVGRALSESKNAKKIEEIMLSMIKDDALDDYNRVLMYYLFLNYNHNIDDKKKQLINKNKLIEAVKQMPSYLSKNITIK